MTLPEAIRLGAMLRPQGFGSLRGFGKSCAMGAAGEATGLTGRGMERRLRTLFPELDETVTCSCRVQCPWHHLRMRLGSAITHLNDYHRFKRERIADYVERVSKPVTTATVEEREAEPRGPSDPRTACSHGLWIARTG